MINKGLVTCNGCFDGLHQGHMFFLGFACGQGERVVVAINSDDYIRKHKRDEPNVPQELRVQQLMELGFISDVRIMQEEEPSNFIREMKPEVHCVSEEYLGIAHEEKVCRELGVKMVYVPRVGDWATSNQEN